MPQIRLTYFSKAMQEMSLMDIQNILQTARDNNAEEDICGMLCYESQWFLQTLEGDRDAVNELFLEISEDPRHEDVVITSYEYIDECLFGNWQMGYAGSSGEFNTLLKDFGLESFDPPSMSPEQSLEFLKTMSSLQNETVH